MMEWEGVYRELEQLYFAAKQESERKVLSLSLSLSLSHTHTHAHTHAHTHVSCRPTCGIDTSET